MLPLQTRHLGSLGWPCLAENRNAYLRRSRHQRILFPRIRLPSPRLPSLRSSCPARRSLCHVVRRNPRVCPPPHHLCSCLHANSGQYHCSTLCTRRALPLSPHVPPDRTFLAARLPTPYTAHPVPCPPLAWVCHSCDVAVRDASASYYKYDSRAHHGPAWRGGPLEDGGPRHWRSCSRVCVSPRA